MHRSEVDGINVSNIHSKIGTTIQGIGEMLPNSDCSIDAGPHPFI